MVMTSPKNMDKDQTVRGWGLNIHLYAILLKPQSSAPVSIRSSFLLTSCQTRLPGELRWNQGWAPGNLAAGHSSRPQSVHPGSAD